MMAYVEFTRADLNAFLRSAVILAMAKPEYINGGVRVRDATIIDGSLRLDIDNGDIVYLDFEHLVPRDRPEPRIVDWESEARESAQIILGSTPGG